MTFEPHRRQLLLCLLAGACSAVSPSPPTESVLVVADELSVFHKVYDSESLKSQFFHFYQEVFRLYPPEALHELVSKSTKGWSTDQQIFAEMVLGLPEISPFAKTLRFALPALAKQKRVIASQCRSLLSGQTLEGYLEVGTVGRYFRPLKSVLKLKGPTFVLNDRRPSRDLSDVVERGQVAEVGTFIPLNDYAPISKQVPSSSLDLVTCFIGLHHCPDEQLSAFLHSISRVLRPTGRLVLREHDVSTPSSSNLVTLAHVVFNAATQVTWEENHEEFRHFRSVKQWVKLLNEHGLQRLPGELLQSNDPTKNVMLCFGRA